MKKIILLVIFFSVIPFTAFAISGACSSHGGVNCATQDPSTGNSICNDGFVSSVPYSQTDECQSVCVQPPVSGCTNESNLGAIEEQSARNGGQYDAQGSAAQVNACQQQIIDYRAAESAYQNCLSSHSNQSSFQSQTNNEAVDPGGLCAKYYGVNGFYDSNSGDCVCKTGYVLSLLSGCVTPQEECTKDYGQNWTYNLADNKCEIQLTQSSPEVMPVQPTPIITPVTPPVVENTPIAPTTNKQVIVPLSIKKVIVKPIQPAANQSASIQTIKQQPPTTNTPINQPKPMPTKNMFSNIWDFIKNIF